MDNAQVTNLQRKAISGSNGLNPGGEGLRFLDPFFVLRPILFFPAWTTAMAGYLASRGQNQSFLDSGSVLFPPGEFLAALGLFAMIMGASFVLNQLKDRNNDRHNEKLFFISQGYLSTATVYLEILLLTLIPLAVAIITGDFTLAVNLLLFFMITGILYNFPPFALKDTPIIGMLANSAMGVLAFSVGWFFEVEPESLNSAIFSDFLLASVPYACFNTALFLLTTIPDFDGDRLDNKRTFSVRFGKRASARLAFFFLLLSVGGAVWRQDIVLLLPAVGSLPFLALLLRDQKTDSTTRAIKYPLFFLTTAVGIKFLFYLPLCFAFFFLTRWYYKNRFNLVYPSFEEK